MAFAAFGLGARGQKALNSQRILELSLAGLELPGNLDSGSQA